MHYASSILTGVSTRIARAIRAEPAEFAILIWSFIYFFCLLGGYYVLRPVRDEMGIRGGVEALAGVFTATFLAMLAVVPLFGWAVGRFSRLRLVPVAYGFFIFNLVGFYVVFKAGIAPEWTARVFFVWVSVFNLFVISLFWSVMNDAFSETQARRLFGVIAAGGSLGAVVGPALTTGLVGVVGPIDLLPISAALLIASCVCAVAVMRLSPKVEPRAASRERSYRGIWSGATRVARSPYLLAICVFIVLYTSLSTFLYFEQAHILENTFDSSVRRTRMFAIMDLATNSITLFLQFFATARIIAWIGLPVTLALIPVFVAAGFGALALWPTLAVLVVFQVVRRTGNYAITRPAREMLFAVVPREDKYKAKNFIDTVVYRGGDAVSGWAFAGLTAIGLGLSAIAFVAVPIAGVWALFAFWLGRQQVRLRPGSTSSVRATGREEVS